MEPGLLLLLIPVLILVLLYFMPELLRWLSRRNRQQAGALETTLADVGESLRTFAARLRPYRDLHADTFRRRYEPARERLQSDVEAYQRLNRRLAAGSPSDKPFGLWAFVDVFRNPQTIWQTPATTIRLRSLKRDIDKLRAGLGDTEALIAHAEETPGGLVQAVRRLREQRLVELQTAIREEREAGLASANALHNRLSQLLRQTDMLLDTVQDGSASGLSRMDTLASELDQLEEATAALETDASALRRQRRGVETRLDEIAAAKETLRAAAAGSLIEDSLQPLLDAVETLEDDARAQQGNERFSEAETRATEALELLQLTGDLSTAAGNVHDVRQIAADSLQAEAIEGLSRRLHTTFRAAYALYEAHDLSSPPPLSKATENGETDAAPASTRRREALGGLRLRANQLAVEAQEVRQAHDQDVRRLTEEADREATELEEAWQTLQQTVSLPQGDPVITHYRALQTQRAQAASNPLKLQTYTDEARTLTRELTTAAETIRHGFTQLETLRVELPAMLERAESEAQNWRSLQPLLVEMKESIATLWQIGGSDVQLAEMQATLSEIETLEEQVRAAYAAFDGERRRLAVLERRIMQTLQSQTLRRSYATAGEDPVSREALRSRVEARLASARGADSIEGAHGALRETLDWLDSGKR